MIPASSRPEPGRFWIRYAARGWPAPEEPWVDLAAARVECPAGEELRREELGREEAEEASGAATPERTPEWPAAEGEGRRRAASLAALDGPLDDLLYLPPVPVAFESERRREALRHLAEGTPVLVQLSMPREADDRLERAAAELAGATRVVDLLPALLAGGGWLGEAAPLAGGSAVWPMVPGVGDEPAAWDEGLARLAAAGYSRVQPVAVRTSPADRRRLAERLEARPGLPDPYLALFHRPPPEEAAFARAAAAAGLDVLLPRPLPRGPWAALAGRRRLAGLLGTAGELWLWAGRPEGQAHALYRAARWVDETAYDVAALARDGNLAVVPDLDAASRRLLEEALAGEPALVGELAEEVRRLGREGRGAGSAPSAAVDVGDSL